MKIRVNRTGHLRLEFDRGSLTEVCVDETHGRIIITRASALRAWSGFLSGGTDGIDGPTDAAGGFVDSGTIARIRSAGSDPRLLLDNNDAYHALDHAGDLLVTGATGTNVADLQILLMHPG